MVSFKTLIILLIFTLTGVIVNAQINQYHEDGTRHGIWEKKFEGRDQIRYSGKFDHGVEVGDFKFYSRGVKGHPTAIKTFSEKGVKAEIGFYTKTGRLISKGVEVNRKREGKWEYYHNKVNKLMMVEFYENGLLEGERLSYYDNGQISEKIEFLNGEKEGKQLVYSVKGVLIKEFTYKANELDGINRFFSGRGNLTIEGMYKEDKKEGIWRYYDANGNITKEKKQK